MASSLLLDVQCVCVSQGGPVMTVEEELEMKKLKARVHVLAEDNWRNGTRTFFLLD